LVHAMGKISRGNYIFVTREADHSPRHVHILKDHKMIAKWDLDGWRLMEGKVNRRILELLKELRAEGKL
jgi:hypothetical protein